MSHQPTLEEARALAGAGRGNLLPVSRELAADLETPVSAYLKVREGGHSFLLESVEGGERLARYSFIGANPRRVIRTGPGEEHEGDPLIPLEAALAGLQVVELPGLPRLTGGAVGYVAYEAVRHFEPRVPANEADPVGIPEAMFLLCDSLVVFDHLRHTIRVLAHCRLDGDVEAEYRRAAETIDAIAARLERPLAAPAQDAAALARAGAGGAAGVSNVGREGYELMVERIRADVIAGEIIQAVPSQRIRRPVTAHPFAIYRQLRTVNPSPYMFYLDLGGFQIVGASPEMLVRVEDGVVTTHPIAGTRPRGATAEEDEALAAELLADEKERAEHIMLVDLGRNDVGRVAEAGSVRVDQLMGIERYSHVMHLVSRVSGRLRADRTPFDAFRAVFPAGTVSGAPKVRAMEIIAALERERRGVYAGAVGYASFAGALDTCIAIRTMVVKDGQAWLQAGGGIVYDSEPAAEYRESVNKMLALERAIDRAELAAAARAR